MRKDNPIRCGVEQFITECKTERRSRQWIAMGLVMLDHIRQRCPLERTEYVSQAGGEIRNSRSGLAEILERYGLPATFLREITTRKNLAYGDRFAALVENGAPLAQLPDAQRHAFLSDAATAFREQAEEWLAREHLRIQADRSSSPVTWISSVLAEAAGRSGGKVEQHLVGAKLVARFPGTTIPNAAGHAADVQTRRDGDISLGASVFHVTASPSGEVIEKCKRNVAKGLRPILLVPGDMTVKAKHLAEDRGISNSITVLGIEDFIAMNIIEIAEESAIEQYDVLDSIVSIYNQRLEEVESDPALKIELE